MKFKDIEVGMRLVDNLNEMKMVLYIDKPTEEICFSVKEVKGLFVAKKDEYLYWSKYIQPKEKKEIKMYGYLDLNTGKLFESVFEEPISHGPCVFRVQDMVRTITYEVEND